MTGFAMDKSIPIEATPVTSFRLDFVDDQTGSTSTLPPPLLVSPLRTSMPFDDSNKDSYDADTGPSTGPVKRKPCDDETHTTTAGPPPLMVTPLQTIRQSNNYSYDAGAGPSTGQEKRGPGRPKGSKNSTPVAKKPKTQDSNSRMVLSCSNFDSGITKAERETGNQELVDSVLMRFDAVRRRLCQLNYSKGILTTASSNCKNLGVQTNMRRRIGTVPGVQVGDIFYYWGEMCLVGLHRQMVAGIDYLSARDVAVHGHAVATSVVTSGQYGNETEELETLIYAGQGGRDKNDQPCDQHLKRGNLALYTSKKIGNDVRVIRGKEYAANKNLYIYDGLYLVTDVWIVIGKSGFKEFRFKLERKPNQSNSGYAIWKSVEDLRKDDSIDTRQGSIVGDLSFGKELLRVPLVNEVDEDDKTHPEDFDYIRSQYYSSVTPNIHIDRHTLGCQNCQAQSCIHQSSNCACMCMRKKDGVLPYHNSILVCRKPLIYECGESCPCPNDCKNRVVQTGLKLRMEVFKTVNCGWGLRSWDPIRAGTFICEFAGVSKTKEEVEDNDDDDYLFDSSRIYNSWFKWNYEPELVGEHAWQQVPEVINLPTQVLISAKEKGNVGRFMNHSCSPNVLWQPIEYENKVNKYIRIGLFAMKHIPPMTELTYDYGVSSVEKIGEDETLFRGKKICLCGSVNCRGSFG